MFFRSFFRSNRRRRNNRVNQSPKVIPKVIKKSPVLTLLRRRLPEAAPSQLKTLKAIARLETARKLRKDLNNPKDFLKSRLTSYVPLRYTFKVLNFKTKNEICRARKARRDEIMKRTKGKGLKIKKANWTASSFLQCR